MRTIAAVISKHAIEIPLLWERRCLATGAANVNLANLADLDGRVEAHLDGLRIAGDDAWPFCQEELRWRGPGEVFGAAVFALENGNQQRMARVADIALANPEAMPGLVSALGWLPFSQAVPQIRRFAADASPALRRASLAAYAIHRRDAGSLLAEALCADEPLLRARGLRAVGELGRADLICHAADNLDSDHPAVRFWAAWSLTLVATEERALAALRAIAQTSHPGRTQALQLAVRRMRHAAAREWLQELAVNTSRLRFAFAAVGALGDPQDVLWVIDQMNVLPQARAAGEAFSMITGADIAHQRLDRRRPEGFESGPSDDPNDDNVEMDPDENLPWPDAEKVAAWWKKHESEFTPGVRHLLGRPISEGWLEHVLRHGYQRQRAAAALELALRRPGTPLFEVRAPGFRQQQMLS